MAQRRAMSGRPLLVATTGAAVFAVGCGFNEPPPVVGNLVAPPMTQICVDTDPAGAAVVVDGSPATGRCTSLYAFEGETVKVAVSAPGHDSRSEIVAVEADGVTELRVTLNASPAVRPPVGNLVAPPPIPPPPLPPPVQPPPPLPPPPPMPVGNLMPPQPIPPSPR